MSNDVARRIRTQLNRHPSVGSMIGPLLAMDAVEELERLDAAVEAAYKAVANSIAITNECTGTLERMQNVIRQLEAQVEYFRERECKHF